MNLPMPERVGPYRLLHALGSGGMGVVFAAIDERSGARVAVKRMRDDGSWDRERRERFRRECASLRSIHHPGVVQILEDGEDASGLPYMAMELLEGEPLDARLRREGRLDPHDAVFVLAQALDALAVIHAKGIIHRDVKPANLFLCGPRETPAVKLMDFGVAKGGDGEHATLTQTGAAIGTPAYMAPEQVRGDRELDARADVWAAGVVLYQCLSGELPFQAANQAMTFLAVLSGTAPLIAERVPGLPEGLAQIVHAALARDRTARFESAHAMATALRGVLCSPLPAASSPTLLVATALGADASARQDATTPGPVVYSPPGSSASQERRNRRPSPWLLLVASGVVALVVGFGLQFMRGTPFAFRSTHRVDVPLTSVPRATAGEMGRVVLPDASAPVVPLLATGSLDVETTSPCDLTIDGVSRGRAPLRVEGLSLGAHTLVCARPGQSSDVQTVTIRDGIVSRAQVPDTASPHPRVNDSAPLDRREQSARRVVPSPANRLRSRAPQAGRPPASQGSVSGQGEAAEPQGVGLPRSGAPNGRRLDIMGVPTLLPPH